MKIITMSTSGSILTFLTLLTWLMLLNLTGICSGEPELLATPKDTIVNVGSNTNLTCIVAGTDTELQWIISWDATATKQVIPANISQEITGYHYGRDAERGEYKVEYESKILGTTGSDCTHVVHITVLHIKNATLRDAGTFACGGSMSPKAKVIVNEIPSDENSLAGCDLVTVVIGLTCIVGWCLAVVEFGFIICMCLKKPKHVARRRRIARRVSIMLPQSRRAAYDVRQKKRSPLRSTVNAGYTDDDDMVQHIPRLVEIEPGDKENMSPDHEKRQFYVNITDNQKRSVNADTDFPRKVPLVSFAPKSSQLSLPRDSKKKKDRKYQQKKKKVASKKKRPDTLAVVKPFEMKESQRSNPVFDGGTDGDMYINLPGPTETKTRRLSDDYVNEEMVSTPL